MARLGGTAVFYYYFRRETLLVRVLAVNSYGIADTELRIDGLDKDRKQKSSGKIVS